VWRACPDSRTRVRERHIAWPSLLMPSVRRTVEGAEASEQLEMLKVVAMLAYIAAYVALGIHGLWEGYFSKGLRQLRPTLSAEGATLPVFLIAIATFPAAVVGMFLYATGIESRVLSYVWQCVLVPLLAVFAIERRQHYRQAVREPDSRLTVDQQKQFGVWYAAVLAVIELPCLWMNFRVAFPSW